MNRVLVFLAMLGSFIGLSQNNIETVLQKGHSQPILCSDFSPNGELVATGSKDQSIILWNVKSGRIIRTFNHHANHVKSVDFSSDGKTILASCVDNTVSIFEVETGKIIHFFEGPKEEVQRAYYSNADSLIILSLKNNEFRLINSQSLDEISSFEKNYSFYFLHQVTSEAGQIISIPNYKEVLITSLNGKDTVMKAPFDKGFSMGLTKKGDKAIVGSTKLFAKIYNTSTGKEIATLKEGEAKCDGCNTQVGISGTGKYAVTMSKKVDGILWNANNGKKIRTLCKLKQRPTYIKFNQNESVVAIGFNGQFYLYNVNSGKELLHVKNAILNYYEIQFNPVSGSIVVPETNNTATIYSSSGKKIKTLKGYQNLERADGLAFSHENWTDAFILKALSRRRNFTLSPDGKIAILHGVDSSAFVVNTNTGRQLKKLQNHSKIVMTSAFSPDGKTMATGAGDGKITLWNTKDWTVKEELFGHRDVILSLNFNSTGSELVSSAYDRAVIKWNLETGEYHLKRNEASSYYVDFTPNDLYITAGDLDKNVLLIETDAMEEFRQNIGHTHVVQQVSFDEKKNLMASASWDGTVKLWNLQSGMLLAKYKERFGVMHSAIFNEKSNEVVIGKGNGEIIIWDYKTNKVIKNINAHSSPVTWIELSPNNEFLYTMDAEGMLKKWDFSEVVEIYARVQIDQNEWLATSPDGRFDGTSKSLKMVNYVKGNQVVPINSVFNKYYTPELIKKTHERGNQERGFIEDDELFNQQEIKLGINYGKIVVQYSEDTVVRSKQNKIKLQFLSDVDNEALSEIRFYNNQKLVHLAKLNEEISFRGNLKKGYEIDLELSNGINQLHAVAKDKNSKEFWSDKLKISFDGEAAKTDLHVLAIGVNQYKNPKYNLTFAKGDAKAIVKSLELGADTLFNKVVIHEIYDKNVSKASVQSKVDEIKKVIGPEDVFVFYYAGHGTMTQDKESDFYLVTHEVTNLYGDAEQLKEKAISATELLNYSIALDAQKQLFVIDACHSGGAIKTIMNSDIAKRGDGREKALAQLARSTGTYFLTASQDAQYANEAGELKHGLFTYALLEILQGKTPQALDERITINEMKTYAEERVPELTEKHHGSPQYPTSFGFGQDFPIVIVK